MAPDWEARRWQALAAGVLVEAVAGSPYAFSVWSTNLKSELAYTQAQVNTVGAVGDLGLYVSVIGGVLFDAAGPRTTLAYGAGLTAAGYVLLWLSATRRLASSPALVALWAAVAWQGTGCLDVVAVAVGINNFKYNKGAVMGIIKSLFGLSSAIYSLAYASLLRPDTDSFLLFCAFAVPAVVALTMYFHRLIPEGAVARLTPRQLAGLGAGYAAVAATALYLVLMSLLQGRNVLAPQPAYAYLLVPALAGHLLLALPPAWLPRSWRSAGGGAAGEGAAAGEDAARGIEDAQQALLADDEGGAVKGDADEGAPSPAVEAAAPALTQGASLVQALLSRDYLILLAIVFGISGTGLVVINNLGSVVASLTSAADAQDVYVSLLSVANCLGRISWGYASDRWAHRLSRPGWLALLTANMSAAMLLLAFSDLSSLYVAAMWVGFTYGGYFSVGPAFVAERWGGRYFASICSVTNVATAVASYALNAGLAAAVYQAHTPAGSTACTGSACFQLTFLLLAALNVLATGLVVLLFVRTRSLYDERGRAVPYDEFAAGRPASPMAAAIEALFACKAAPPKAEVER